ncbi:hypothetical protein F5883DRAFT_564019 [Diaporthe sp. PMI_573]|nr:hypothetical protein F5883DRAFT_564019 [Diaporthaceae sp. PMI_573]
MEITGNAFVTGGASGIGRACCIAFAKEGARGLVVADINLTSSREASGQHQVHHRGFRLENPRVDVPRGVVLPEIVGAFAILRRVRLYINALQRRSLLRGYF